MDVGYHLARQASPLNRASAPPHEQPLSRVGKSKTKQNLQQKHQINFIRLFKSFSFVLVIKTYVQLINYLLDLAAAD